MYKLMTPGPTMVKENVRLARSAETPNPDFDLAFYDEYKETCELLSKLLHTQNESLILGGEGILGLEAACASFTEAGDKVLVLDNGVYGKGFADFVKMYGGVPTLYTTDYEETIDVIALKKYLENNHDFKYATVVHCDTPSGMLNDIDSICPLLKNYGILTVVDAVSSMFGHDIYVDEAQIDILCGGSQKALSAPAGLTMVALSKDAKHSMQNRKTPIAAFYANLTIFENYYENKWFPYTMPISDIYGLRQALYNIDQDKDIVKRHERIASAVRKALIDAGFSLYARNGYSNTVTVFKVPEGITAEEVLHVMKETHHIMLAGSFDVLAGMVIRIGHMGTNANVEDVKETLMALEKTLISLGMNLSLHFSGY